MTGANIQDIHHNDAEYGNGAHIHHIPHSDTHCRKRAHIPDIHSHDIQPRKPKVKYTLVQTLTVSYGPRVATYWIELKGKTPREGKPQSDPNKPMTKNQLIHYFRRNYTNCEITKNGNVVESTMWPDE
jgi:hypothetical protein